VPGGVSPPGAQSAGPVIGGPLFGSLGGGVQIENFYATPSHSPADIAAELDWISRGGG